MFSDVLIKHRQKTVYIQSLQSSSQLQNISTKSTVMGSPRATFAYEAHTSTPTKIVYVFVNSSRSLLRPLISRAHTLLLFSRSKRIPVHSSRNCHNIAGLSDWPSIAEPSLAIRQSDGPQARWLSSFLPASYQIITPTPSITLVYFS
jgi:hypothetical protein